MPKIEVKIMNINYIMVMLAIFAVLISGSVFWFALSNSDQAARNGPWGDFVSGTLNPILTFLAFLGVLISIAIQKRELLLSRQEFERSANALESQIKSIDHQNFEVAFFQMLNTFNQIVDGIDVVRQNNSIETSGRDCFKVFYTRLTKEYRKNSKSKGNHRDLSILNLSYSNFWRDNQLELAHYFRFLYNILRFMKESGKGEAYHAKLLRAQISDQELLVLYYNCLSPQGENFMKYAIEFELFDNLPTVRLLHETHVDLIDRKAFGSNPMTTPKEMRLQE